jgi:hypothetical protein
VSDALPLAVRLTSAAVDQLAEIDFSGERERGAFLYGFADDLEITVCLVGPARADGYEGTSDEVFFDPGFAAERERVLAEGPGWRAVGTAHSHPGDDPDAPMELSPPDENFHARWAKNLHESIATVLLRAGPNGYDPWADPRMSAWLTAQDGVCRPACLIVEPRTYY